MEEIFDQVAITAICSMPRHLREFSLRGLRFSSLDALRLAVLRLLAHRALSQFLHSRLYQRYDEKKTGRAGPCCLL